MLRRGGELTSSGISYAGEQLRSGQQVVRERGGDAAQSMTGWREDTGARLRRQGKNLARSVDDLRDEAAYQLRKQGRSLSHDLEDRREEATYQLRKQRRSLSHNLEDRREEAAHRLRKRGRSISRDLADRRDIARSTLSRQGQNISERSARFLEPMRRVFPFIGFFSGLLLAAAITFWLLRRALVRQAEREEGHIELTSHNTREKSRRRLGSIISASRGGATVSTRSTTVTEAPSRYVGVRSTREYYPIKHTPNADVQDLVFFASEDAARAQGFRAAHK
jgi:hypothetical protein